MRSSRCSRLTHAGWCPRALCCCPALLTRQASSLEGGGATPRHATSSTSSRQPALSWLKRVACAWRCYCVWMSSSLLRFRRLSGCEGTTLLNAFLSAFNTLSVFTQLPRGCHGRRRPWRRLANRAGDSRNAPCGALAPYPTELPSPIHRYRNRAFPSLRNNILDRPRRNIKLFGASKSRLSRCKFNPENPKKF